MQANALPRYDMSDNPTGCCPRFDPTGWDNRDLHFQNKRFVRATTKSVMHVPVNMGKVFDRVQRHIAAAGAVDPEDFIVLSHDLSAWQAEHLFAVTKPVPDEAMTTLSGDFVTKVFEGAYRNTKHWFNAMQDQVRKMGRTPAEIYFFYTTCPKCTKAYGKNYVVGVARVQAGQSAGSP